MGSWQAISKGYFVSIRSAESYLLYTAALWTHTLGTRALHCSAEFHVTFSQRPLLFFLNIMDNLVICYFLTTKDDTFKHPFLTPRHTIKGKINAK